MLCEINPLIVTPEGEVRALDSKFTVDDNALYKHEDIAAMLDLDAYPPEERLAREKGVTYVKLDGEVGILGNGAGLVMSTLDVIALAGGRAANFCDLGGGGTPRASSTRSRSSPPTRRSNPSSSTSSAGSRAATRSRAGSSLRSTGWRSPIPIVVRLDGTNAEEGRRLLEESDAPIDVEPTMLDAARRAVELVGA